MIAIARGFTLLEVLIALVITSIGLLGIAKIQALAYSSTSTAGVRSLVAIEAASLASTMHSNRTYWSTTGPSSWAGTNPLQLVITRDSSGAVHFDDPTLNTDAPAANCLNSPCSNPATVAAYDLYAWASALQSLLPNANPTATIACPQNVPISCTVTIDWAEKTVAINKQGTNSATVLPPTYTLYVQP